MLEGFPVNQIANAERVPVDLGRVAGADALKSRANLLLTFLRFADFIEAVGLPVDVGDEGGAITDQQASRVIDAVVIELLQFVKHNSRMNNNAVAKDVLAPAVEDTAGKKVERVLLPVNNDCVTGV